MKNNLPIIGISGIQSSKLNNPNSTHKNPQSQAHIPQNPPIKPSRWDAEPIRESAIGRWPEILTASGIDPVFLKRTHGPCPFCGGKDRWRFDNKDGRGTGFCAQCLPGGDGFSILARHLRMDIRKDFGRLLAIVAGILGIKAKTSNGNINSNGNSKPPPANRARENHQARTLLKKTMSGTLPLTHSQAAPARRYLCNRGLSAILTDLPRGKVLRYHATLPYWHNGREYGHFSAIVAIVQGANGQAVTLHRTFLSADGWQANVPGSTKKLMTAVSAGSSRGGAIRLYQATDTLALAEGIETALAIRAATGTPVWSVISASFMQSIVIPEQITRVEIWADLDRSGAGQQAAAALAQRLSRTGRQCKVIIPAGSIANGQKSLDWLDIFNQQEVYA